MGLIIVVILGIISGMLLFKKNTIKLQRVPNMGDYKLTVIIPARNEEKNLPVILSSLRQQTLQPYEIIVVDDGSSDRTKEIAQSYGVMLIENPPMPSDWTGKTWSVWNGYLHSSGELIAFLDADINLAPHALESLIIAREKKGGVLSVVPFHRTKKFYERFALITNILGVFAFTSLFEKANKNKGLYGSCILTTREDYEKIDGHSSIKSEVLDDLSLGGKYVAAGVSVHNYLGSNLVSFRMYPNGFVSELQGFAKSAVLSTAKLNIYTVLLIALWVIGLIVTEAFIFFIHTSWFFPLFIGYLLYMLQIFALIRYVGSFGVLMPILHFLSTLFFLLVMLFSAYQVLFLRQVIWKGRNVKVGRGRHR